MANFAWVISVVAMTIAFATFFSFSATRRRNLLYITLVLLAITVIAALVAGFTQ